MKHLARAFGLGLAALLASTGAAIVDSEGDLHALMRDYDAFAHDQDPYRAASRGDIAALARWPDDSPAAVAVRKKTLEGFAARLAATDKAALSPADATERDVLRWRVNDTLEGLAFDQERVPFTSGEGFNTDADFTGTQTNLPTVAAAEAWLKKLGAFPAFYATEIANMRRAIATHFTQPRLVVENTLTAARSEAATAADASPLYHPLTTLPSSVPAKTRKDLQSRGLALMTSKVKPAQQALVRFLETEYLPAARPALGVGTLNEGKRYYAYLARHHTTTTMTPEQIHALGVKEVARIRGEMDKIIAEVHFKGSFQDFLKLLRSDPRFYPKNADDLMNHASEIANRINGELPRWFGHLPRLTYAVVFIPPSIETSSAGYLGGSEELGVAGKVLLRRTGAEHRTLYDLPSWVLHEGSPGHHVQIALADEIEGLPEYRRNDDVTAFVEGWALYTERLGIEMGIYRDAYERFGQLSMDMWRACRLEIDTGVHVMGWTRDQAVACLRDNSALDPASIEKEVDRYIGWPGQALAYKVGQLTILDIRAKAEAKLGSCFDIRRFHDQLLGAGSIPLDALRARMAAWTAAEAKTCSGSK